MAKNTKGEQELELFLKKVGANIRSERDKKGLTLEQVEEAGYTSWRHLQKVESGQPVTLKTIFNIAKALKVQPLTFFKNTNFK